MKDCVLVAPINGLKYATVFPLMKENKLRCGNTNFNRGMFFYVPEEYEYEDTYKFEREKDGKKAMRYSSVCWVTTLPVQRPPIELTKTYDPDEYPRYENEDGIEVKEYKLIPANYQGVMGVPITFLGKINPDQFEILGHRGDLIVNGRTVYARLLIRRKQK